MFHYSIDQDMKSFIGKSIVNRFNKLQMKMLIQ